MTAKSDIPYKYSHFSAIRTEDLKAFLRNDSMQDEEPTDTDAILYISTLIAEREAEALRSEFDSSAAWQSFMENYHPDHCADEVVLPDNITLLTDLPSKSVNKSRRLKTTVICVAAIVALFIAVTVTASAFGYDFLGLKGRWNNSKFSFSVNALQSAHYADWLLELNKYGIDASMIIPKRIPERFADSGGIIVEETPIKTVFMCTYTDGDNGVLSIHVSKRTTPSSMIYEKDDDEARVVSLNDIDHYVFNNVDHLVVVWTVEDFECSISGNITDGEMNDMLASIYE